MQMSDFACLHSYIPYNFIYFNVAIKAKIFYSLRFNLVPDSFSCEEEYVESRCDPVLAEVQA